MNEDILNYLDTVGFDKEQLIKHSEEWNFEIIKNSFGFKLYMLNKSIKDLLKAIISK